MRFKPLRHITIFLVIWLGMHFTLRSVEAPESISALVFIPAIYAIIHLVRCINNLSKLQLRAALNSFTITLLFALISSKLLYMFYNPFLSILLLIFCSWVTKLAWKKDTNAHSEQNKITLLSLLALNIILLPMPDDTLLLYKAIPHEIGWQKLTWSNFEGIPNDTADFDAQTDNGIHYLTNLAYNYPPAIVSSQMTPGESWVRKEKWVSHTDSRILLEHEQGHFNITELYRRKICDSIKAMWGKPENAIDTVINFLIKKKNALDDAYDTYTDHGKDTIGQHTWTNLMEHELQSNEIPNPQIFMHLMSYVFGRVSKTKEGAENKLVNGVKEGKWVEYITRRELKNIHDTSIIYEDDGYTNQSGIFIPRKLIITSEHNSRYYAVSYYCKGKKCGISYLYSKNGKLVGETPFIDNIEDGTEKTYYENGNLSSGLSVLKGKWTGIEKWYFENGKIKFEVPYLDGKRNGVEKEYYESGVLKWEENFINDQQNGLQKGYYSNGILYLESSWVNDQPNGHSRMYSINGNLLSERTYVNGKVVATKNYDTKENEIK